MGNRNVTIPAAIAIPGVFAGDAKFLASDYIPDITDVYGQLVTVHLALDPASANSVIRYSLDSGTTWTNFLNGDELTGGSGLERPILLRFGDQLNFSAAVTITLAFCRVDLV